MHTFFIRLIFFYKLFVLKVIKVKVRIRGGVKVCAVSYSLIYMKLKSSEIHANRLQLLLLLLFSPNAK